MAHARVDASDGSLELDKLGENNFLNFLFLHNNYLRIILERFLVFTLWVLFFAVGRLDAWPQETWAHWREMWVYLGRFHPVVPDER